MKLSDEQKSVIKDVLRFDKDVQKVSGYAGTGKSTVIKHLASLLPGFAVCAYTGKAASVLTKKGIRATTIHSLIYRAFKDDGKVRFSLNSSLDCQGIIVDEASMVGKFIYQDLLWFNKPVIFVGDHGQLEPIGDDFNVMEKPDFVLETIHRNAGEIAHFADHIRKGYKPGSWQFKGPGDKVKFVQRGCYKDVVPKVEQIICAFNKTRSEMNRLYRKSLNLHGDYPSLGDRVMCLRNERKMGLFNGMQGTVEEVYDDDSFLFKSDEYLERVSFDRDVFNKVKYEFEKDGDLPFDYGYAITAHRAQGSEYDSVMVLEQKCDLWDHRRWAYTAASRARELLYWCEF